VLIPRLLDGVILPDKVLHLFYFISAKKKKKKRNKERKKERQTIHCKTTILCMQSTIDGDIMET
jgi:hypothetical protein